MTRITKLVVGILFGAAGWACAAPQVYWGHLGTSSVLVNFGASSSATANRLAIGSIVQLIKSSDAAIDPINPANPFDPATPGGNDALVLQGAIGLHPSYPTGSAGRFYYGTADAGVTPVPFAATDYLYMRVFQATSTVLMPGILYFAQGSSFANSTTGILPGNIGTPASIPSSVDIWAPDGTTSVAFRALDQSVTVIPEPAAAGIGLAGVALLAWRRRRLAQG